MKNRLLPLFVLAAVFVLAAPVAMADHCVRCNNNQCTIAVTGGYWNCWISNGVCTTSGTCGGPHPLIETETPFALEFTVASVERLDEPQPSEMSETRVASLEKNLPEVQR